MLALSGRMRNAYHGETFSNGYFADDALLGASFFDPRHAEQFVGFNPTEFGHVSASASSSTAIRLEPERAIQIGTDFVVSGNRWTHNVITWSFQEANYDNQMGVTFAYYFTPGSAERNLITQAFAMWDTAATYLTFQQVTDGPDVDIRIGWGENLPNDPGRNTLGEMHPIVSGTHPFTAANDIYNTFAQALILIDAADRYPDLPGGGPVAPFMNVVLHEIGHAIGLGHYDISSAVMNTEAGNLTSLTSHETNGVNYLYPSSVGGGGSDGDYTAALTSVSPTSVSPGQTITISYRITNAGSQPADNMEWKIFLSQDQTISVSNESVDVPVGSGHIISPLGAGQSVTGTFTYTIPSNYSGTYYLGMVADYGNFVVETNENNNISSLVTLNIGGGGGNGPDLQVTGVNLSTTNWVTGQQVTVNYSVKNFGNQAVPLNSGLINYLITSRDTSFSIAGGDQSAGLDTNNFPTLAAGNTYSGTMTFTVSAQNFSAGAGTYYVSVLTDGYPNGTGSLTETNENNNWSQPIQINFTPALNRAPTVTAPQANVAATPGQTIALSSMFSASDADGNALTYFVYDGNAAAGSGRVILNGSAIPAGTSYQMTAAQFAQATFVAGASGSDNIAVQVFDGQAYSGNAVVSVSVNRPPVVTAPQANVVANAGQSLAVSGLFRASDPDGNALTYFVYDGNAGAGSGRVMLNGTAIPANTSYQMTAAQFAQATFVAGTSGSDNLSVQVFDGKAYSGWNTVVNVAVNRTPVVTAPQANVTATAGQTIALSSMFSASDPDGNALTYFVYDGTAGANSGRIMLNGTAIPANTPYHISAAQFAQATFVAGAAGNTDALAVQAYDGKAFSGYTAVNVAVPAAPNHPPVVTASQANVTATAGQTFTLSSRFAASDPDGDALTYFVYDSNAGAGSGRIMLNGTAIPAGAGYQMTAAQFAQATFVAGSAGSSDDIRVQVFDGKAYSGWNTGVVFSVPAAPADDYRDRFSDTTAALGQITVNGTKTGNLEVNGDRDWFAVQLVANVNYTFNLQGTTGGGGTLADPYLRLYNGNGSSVLASNDDIGTSNHDSQFTYRPTTSGTYYLEAGAYTDSYTGTYRIGFTQPFNHPPGITLNSGSSVRAAAPQSIALTSLFSGSDIDGDPLTYFVYDGNAAANSGRFMLNGTAIPAAASYQMTAAQFAQATFVAGAGGVSDNISVQVFDGQAYSGWSAAVLVSANNTPVVTAPQANVTATAGQTFALSSLFSASDRDSDALTYFVYDGNAGATSGRVMLNGSAIPAGAGYQMTAAQFAQATFVAGAGNTADNIAVQVFDGRAYSGYTAVQLSVPNSVPIVTAPQANVAATGHQSIPLTSLFTVSDGDGDALTYFVYDGTAGASSGRIMLNGTAIPANTTYHISAAQFAQATFVTGDGGSADSIAVQAFDGRAYSGYTAVQLSVANHAPTVSLVSGASYTASAGQSIRVSTLFSGNDSDGDALTYYLYDSNASASSGHFVVGGNAVPAQTITQLTAAQFATATFVTGAGGTSDSISVQAYDGTVYSGWNTSVQVGVPAGANHAPTIVMPSGSSVSTVAGVSIPLSALFSGSDLDGDTLTYMLSDVSADPHSSYYMIDGVRWLGGGTTTITAAQFAQAAFVPVNNEIPTVTVSDGIVATSSSLSFTFTSGNHKPMVGLPAGASVDVNPGQSVALSSLFRGSDVDGNALTYFVYDSNAAANSGHVVIGGNTVPAQSTTAMTAAQLATATFVAGAAGTVDDILVQAFDGQLYSGWNAGVHIFV